MAKLSKRWWNALIRSQATQTAAPKDVPYNPTKEAPDYKNAVVYLYKATNGVMVEVQDHGEDDRNYSTDIISIKTLVHQDEMDTLGTVITGMYTTAAIKRQVKK